MTGNVRLAAKNLKKALDRAALAGSGMEMCRIVSSCSTTRSTGEEPQCYEWWLATGTFFFYWIKELELCNCRGESSAKDFLPPAADRAGILPM